MQRFAIWTTMILFCVLTIPAPQAHADFMKRLTKEYQSEIKECIEKQKPDDPDDLQKCIFRYQEGTLKRVAGNIEKELKALGKAKNKKLAKKIRKGIAEAKKEFLGKTKKCKKTGKKLDQASGKKAEKLEKKFKACMKKAWDGYRMKINKIFHNMIEKN